MTDIVWPPAYTVKKHPRAKHVRLRACRKNGLVITVPPRFSLRHMPAVLETHRDWIMKHMASLQRQQERELPDSLYLAALNETWQVHYMKCDTALKLFTRPGNEIVILGKTNNEDHYYRLLVTWLKSYARRSLEKMLKKWSEHMQLPYANYQVRDQRSLWGSCTSTKNISLNYRLILLPPELMNYVIIHELAHTVHLNHSSEFWGLVEEYDSHWRTHRQRLVNAQQSLPNWT